MKTFGNKEHRASFLYMSMRKSNRSTFDPKRTGDHQRRQDERIERVEARRGLSCAPLCDSDGRATAFQLAIDTTTLPPSIEIVDLNTGDIVGSVVVG